MTETFQTVSVVTSMYRASYPDNLFPSPPTITLVTEVSLQPDAFPFNTLWIQFYTVTTSRVKIGVDEIELTSAPILKSPRYFVTGTVLTLEQLAEEYPRTEILRQALAKGAQRILRTKQGRLYTLDESDYFLEALASQVNT